MFNEGTGSCVPPCVSAYSVCFVAHRARKGCLALTAQMERMAPRVHLVLLAILDRLVFLEREYVVKHCIYHIPSLTGDTFLLSRVPRELVASQVTLENLARKVLLESPESLV